MPSIGIQAKDALGDRERRAIFRKGRRAGIWLALNGPLAQKQRRREDIKTMRQQDRDLEGLGDVFARAEEEPRPERVQPRPAEQEGKYDDDGPRSSSSVFGGTPGLSVRMRRPTFIVPPSLPPPASAPPARIKLTPENASKYIGKEVFFNSGGKEMSATIVRVTASGLGVSGGPPSIRNNLVFKGRHLTVYP